MEELRTLSTQRVLILGGGGAMGREIARLAHVHGAHVTLAGRNNRKLVAAAEEIGPDVALLELDASSEAGIAALTRGPAAPYDHVVVATSAGARASSIPATSVADAQAAFGRYWTSYLVLHYASQLLTANGSVTLLSGSSGRRPAAGYGVWSALHGGIEALARAAALELSPIRVNVLSPGGIGISPDRNIVHHAGQPSDLALAVVMVMGNRAMTGAIVDVDGGERLGTWSGP